MCFFFVRRGAPQDYRRGGLVAGDRGVKGKAFGFSGCKGVGGEGDLGGKGGGGCFLGGVFVGCGVSPPHLVA